MALTAAVAVALAAVMAAVAVGDLVVAGREIPVLVFPVGLVPGLVLSARHPQPRPVPVPSGNRIPFILGGLVLASYALSFLSSRLDLLGAALLLAVIPLSLFWPRPAALRLCVALVLGSVLALGPPLDRQLLMIALVVAASVLALVVTARVPFGSPPRLASPSAARTGPIGRATATVAAAAVGAGILASLLILPPPPRGLGGGSDAAARPVEGRRTAPGGDAVLGYPEEIDVAGAGPRGGAERLFRVEADRPEVWRARTFSNWDGRRWSTAAPLGQAYRSPGGRVLVPQNVSGLHRERFRHRVTIEAGRAEVLVAAPEPVFMFPPGPVLVGFDGSVRPVPPLGRSSSYTVYSWRAAASAATLRAASRRTELTPPPEAVFSPLPPPSPRTKALIASITARGATGYDKVVAVERWLARHVEVDRTPAPLPDGADLLDHLLFVERSGSPQRIATAMALMARSVGMPSRLAAGYLPGERGLLGRQYLVRARDAHTWVEVMIGPFGWQRFDPTGLIARAQRADSLASRLRRAFERYWPLLLAVVVMGLVTFAYRLVRRRRRHRAEPWVTRFFARLVRVGSKRGRPRRPDETPSEYASALAGSVMPDERLREVGELVTTAAFSGREPPEDAKTWAEGVLRDVSGKRRPQRSRS